MRASDDIMASLSFATSMPPSKAVALLDVDDTLIVGNFVVDPEIATIDTIKQQLNAVGILNEDLLAALKKNGIKDCYLFTDMTFNASSLMERNALVEILEKRGFNVYGVITPADFAWHLCTESLRKVYESEFATLPRQIDSLKRKGDLIGANEVRQKLISEFNLELQPSLSWDNDTSPGRAFSAIVKAKEYSKKLSKTFMIDITNAMANHSRYAKAYAEIHSVMRDMVHVKGVMLQFFLDNNVHHFNKIVICDDRKDVLESVDQVAAQYHHNQFELTTLYVNNNAKRKDQGEQLESYFTYHAKINDFLYPVKQGKTKLFHIENKMSPGVKLALMALGLLLLSIAIASAMVFSGGLAAIAVGPLVGISSVAASLGSVGMVGVLSACVLVVVGVIAGIGSLIGSLVLSKKIKYEALANDENFSQSHASITRTMQGQPGFDNEQIEPCDMPQPFMLNKELPAKQDISIYSGNVSEVRSEGIKDILKTMLSPNKMAQLENDLKDKSDDEFIEFVNQDLLGIDATIADRINMQKNGARSTSDDPFVRGISFYLFDILDDEKVQNEFLSDLKQLGKIKPLQSTIELVQNHIEEYKECAKQPKPLLHGSVNGRF